MLPLFVLAKMLYVKAFSRFDLQKWIKNQWKTKKGKKRADPCKLAKTNGN